MVGSYDCVDWRDRYSGFVYRIVEQNQGAAHQFAMLMEALVHRYRSHDMGPSDVGRALSEMAPMVRELAEISAAHINRAMDIRRQNVQNNFYIRPDPDSNPNLRPRGPWIAMDPGARDTVSVAFWNRPPRYNADWMMSEEVRLELERQINAGARDAHMAAVAQARDEFMRGFNDEFSVSVEVQRRQHAEKEAAKQKSRQTFLDACSPAQRTQFEHHGTIDVEVKLHSDPRRNGRYCLTKQKSFSITNIHTGEQFCAQILDVPIFDQMLGLKLMLENDPVKFFEVANSNREMLSRALNAPTGLRFYPWHNDFGL